jgi:acetyltransferase-like isoleucine patch superfamily enzyme/dTDP-4-dehydrorhamnose 3,5-epimerase-like enzyme
MSGEVDATALCEARSLGNGSRILAFARVGPEVEIGGDCVVGAHAVLEGEVTLADGVRVQAGARILGPVSVGPGAAIGSNAVLAGSDPTGQTSAILVGRGAVLKAGSVVADNVPANAVVSGNPATIVAYVDAGHEATVRDVVLTSSIAAGVTETGVRGVTIHPLTNARDLRGSLTAAEFSNLPFIPGRLFTVHDVPSESVRGSHAHRDCSQFLVCLAGTLSCLVDDGAVREEIRLANSELGLYIPPMIWSTQWRYSRDAVLLVLASHPYDPADYIRDYEEFLEVLARA